MKKAIKRLISFLLVILIAFAVVLSTGAHEDLCTFIASARESYNYDDDFWEDDEEHYDYEIIGGEAIITSVYYDEGGRITVPSRLGGYPVTAIGDWAFEGNTDITEVFIPDGVKKIGRYAFYGCTSLKGIKVPGSVSSIGYEAFGYYNDDDLWETVKISGFTITSGPSSAAKQYAVENGFEFIAVASPCKHISVKHFEMKATCHEIGISYDVCEFCKEAVNYIVLPFSDHVDLNSDLLCDDCSCCLIVDMTVTGITYSISTGSAVVTWNKLAGATGYTLYKYNFDSRTYEPYVKTKANTAVVSSIPANSTVYLKVKAYKTVDGYDYCSCNSKVCAIYTAPVKVSGIKASSITGTTMTLTWNKAPGATGYLIYKYDASAGKYCIYKSVKNNSAYIFGLSESSVQYFMVRAFKTVSGKKYWGTASNQFRTYTSPAKVAELSKLSVAKSSATLTWQKTQGTDGYRVFKYDAASERFIAYKDVTDNYIAISGLLGNTTYYFKVRAFKKVSGIDYWSIISDALEVTTL